MRKSSNTPKTWRQKKHWQVLSWLVVVLSFFWVGWILRDGIGALFSGEIIPDWLLSTLAFFGVIVSMLIGAKSFNVLMNSTGARFPSYLYFSELYFTGMLMRHLPGRIFGVIYQVKNGNDFASPSQWIVGNFAYILTSTWLAIALSLFALFLFGVDIFALYIGLFFIFLMPLLVFLFKKFLGVLKIKSVQLKNIVSNIIKAIDRLWSAYGFAALGWALLSWLPYTIAWALLGESFSDLGWQVGIQLGALYTLAWAVGYFSLITPGGLGVRELVFAFLAIHYPAEIVAYTAIAARVGLLSSDLIIGGFFIIWRIYAGSTNTKIR